MLPTYGTQLPSRQHRQAAVQRPRHQVVMVLQLLLPEVTAQLRPRQVDMAQPQRRRQEAMVLHHHRQEVTVLHHHRQEATVPRHRQQEATVLHHQVGNGHLKIWPKCSNPGKEG